MNTIKVELPDPAAIGKVISIEVARKHHLDRVCQHYRIRVNPDFSEIECLDCERQLNPIEWIAFLSENWSYVTSLYERYSAAKDLMAEKERTRCQHCHRVTRVNPPSDFDKRMRERRLI